ncbi:hypothetical protein H2203_004757 [Taxawa tesnikishii (nom. ined.)]|nr:hypothetical protein H2203_004757 [Dothideales sp. JES 119]
MGLPGEDLLLCVTCGTHGQQWTSLAKERGKHENQWKQDEVDKRLWSIFTDPKLGIGERACFIQTEHGNVLWDCFAYLGDEAIDFIKSKGGLEAIVISHPHFYTTHLDWAETFDCPVYMHAADREWLNRKDAHGRRVLIEEPTREIVPGVTAIQTGGHFPGSMVLHWEKHLFIADSFVNVPSGFYHKNRPKGTTSYSFMWSDGSTESDTEYDSHEARHHSPDLEGAPAVRVRYHSRSVQRLGGQGDDVKGRVLESMKIQIKHQGFDDHALFSESWP